MRRSLFFLCSSFLLAPFAIAVAPDAMNQNEVVLGNKLFQKTWRHQDPSFNSDGLGPLFNGTSCATCHNQGGLGGGGESRFNAQTIGIEQMKIVGGPVSDDVIKKMVSQFSPGFILPDGTLINTFTISHHGGSPQFASGRDALLKLAAAKFSSDGGPTDSGEVRLSTATPILFHTQVGKYEMSLRARLFQRNTTALWGAGMLDRVTDKQITELARAQKAHPEISGRPATLRDDRIGKFGWRSNVASLVEFTDQASANELGLETKRKPQAPDPTVPNYRNPGTDISDSQIESIASFLAALPTPSRAIPADSKQRMVVDRGEQLFASVGCAVCHVPNVGPAKGIYSDILLHEMGYQLTDLNHAEPYIIRQTPVTRQYLTRDSKTASGRRMVGGYYGPATEIAVSGTADNLASSGRRGFSRAMRPRIMEAQFEFVAPVAPRSTMQIVDIASNEKESGSQRRMTNQEEVNHGLLANTGSISTRKTLRTDHYKRVHFELTKFNEEWRTPPLWGVADSAPYMHDGRADTLLEAISMHGGESAGTRDRYLSLSLEDRRAVIAFLETMVAPHNAQRPAL